WTLAIQGLSDEVKQKLLDAQISGFSSTGATKSSVRAGSFLFYRDAQTLFKEVLTKTRDTPKDEKPLKFDTFAAGVIIHELAHQLDKKGPHYPDSDGNGSPNQGS